jgi:hypothetical protein
MITRIADHGRSGADLHFDRHRFRSSRNLRISEGTYRIPGGSRCLPGDDVVRRMRRYGERLIPFRFAIRLVLVLYLLAFCHQPYGFRTIITHMRIIT